MIGGGIAGGAAARALQRDGAEVTLFERHETLAAEGSGNPAGLITPRLTRDGGASGRFYDAAFLHALGLLDALEGQGLTVRHGQGGVLIADLEPARQRQLIAHYGWPETIMRTVDGTAARELTGLDCPHGGLWFAAAGCIFPALLVAALARDLDLRLGTEIHALNRQVDGWRLDLGGETVDADAVVLANGVFARRLMAEIPLAVTANRGQVTLLEADAAPTAAVSAGGYLTPETGGICVLGATYDRWTDLDDGGWRKLRDADHRRNLADGPGKGAVVGGRAALRAVTADRLPLVGALHDEAAYRRDYDGLHHGRPAAGYPEATYVPGLYTFCGFGSHGLQTAPLAAEVLSGLVLGAPVPVADDLADALHPARFLIRELKKKRR